MSTRALLLAAALAGPSVVQAQFFIIPTAGRAESGWSFDVAGQLARPVGAFQQNVPIAWGVGSTVRHSIWGSPLSLRADLQLLNYGWESRRVPLSTTVNRINVDMSTSNNIALIYAGPELALKVGPFMPYAHAFAGYSYFYTESAASGSNGDYDFASTTNFKDGGLTTGYGGGLRVPLGTGRLRAALDMGGRFTRAGTRTYLTRGDIHDEADGTLTYNPRTTETDFWQAHIGVTFYSRRSDR